MDRSGAFLYDGDDLDCFKNTWSNRFLDGLDRAETEQAERDLWRSPNP